MRERRYHRCESAGASSHAARCEQKRRLDYKYSPALRSSAWTRLASAAATPRTPAAAPGYHPADKTHGRTDERAYAHARQRQEGAISISARPRTKKNSTCTHVSTGKEHAVITRVEDANTKNGPNKQTSTLWVGEVGSAGVDACIWLAWAHRVQGCVTTRPLGMRRQRAESR